MTPTEWVAHFERERMGTIDPRRCTVVPDTEGSLYAALYDLRAFRSFDEFEAWIAWTVSLQPSMVTDGPGARRDWAGPSTLHLPHTPHTTGRKLDDAIQAFCKRPEMGWVVELRPTKGRTRSADSLEVEVLEGWLTLFRLQDDEDDTLTWTRVDLPHGDWVEHLVSDLAIKMKVDLVGLGSFDAAHSADGSRMWFKASEQLITALEHRDAVGGGRTAHELVRALRRNEAVYLPGVGQLTADEVIDARQGARRTTFVLSFQADTEFLMDLDEAVQARTLPPGR